MQTIRYKFTMTSLDLVGSTGWSDLVRQRKAIVVADVVDSVRLMAADESSVIDRWLRFVDEISRLVLPSQGGRMVKSLGDGMLLEFASVVCAVSSALEIQKRAQHHNHGLPERSALHLRIGINVGDVVSDALDIYGTGVNLAARIAALAGPGEVVVAADVRDQLIQGFDAETEDLGDCHLKGFDAPVRAYRVGPPGRQPVMSGREGAPLLQPTVAVLPFGSGSEHERRVVGELLADGVISQLSRTAELRVISRLSSNALSGRVVPPEAIAAHLRANFAVSGSAHVKGSRLVVSAELCETANGSVVWASRLTGDVSELVESHGELIHRIASEVHQAILAQAVQRARAAALPTLEGYALLYGAIHLMHRQSRFEFNRARALLEHLVERHPRHAEPRAWLAKWFALAAAQGWRLDASDAATEARRHVELALNCEPSHALAWAIMGLLQGYVDADFAAAQQAHDESLRHNPNESLAWLYLATLRGWRGERDSAVEAAEQALSLSPLDPLRYYFDSLAGAAMLGARRYERAIELSQRSIRSNRAHLSTFRVLTMAQALSGDEAAARETAHELLRHDPTFNVQHFLQVSPWRMSPDAEMLGEALKSAGIPGG